MNAQLQIDLILQSLPESFGQTIANFHMNKIECTPVELLNLLVMAQKAIHNEKGRSLLWLPLLIGLKRTRATKVRKLRKEFLKLREV